MSYNEHLLSIHRKSYKRITSTEAGRRRHRERVNRAATKRRANGRHNAAMRAYRAANPMLRVTDNLRRRLNALLRGTQKTSGVMALVGCSIKELRAHLESKFEPWMSWDNYGFGPGKWVVDHIRPCASFNMLDQSGQAECFRLSNLRPLCWKQNNRKGKAGTCLP
jgi:hypothetical protein